MLCAETRRKLLDCRTWYKFPNAFNWWKYSLSIYILVCMYRRYLRNHTIGKVIWEQNKGFLSSRRIRNFDLFGSGDCDVKFQSLPLPDVALFVLVRTRHTCCIIPEENYVICSQPTYFRFCFKLHHSDLPFRQVKSKLKLGRNFFQLTKHLILQFIENRNNGRPSHQPGNLILSR